MVSWPGLRAAPEGQEGVRSWGEHHLQLQNAEQTLGQLAAQVEGEIPPSATMRPRFETVLDESLLQNIGEFRVPASV